MQPNDYHVQTRIQAPGMQAELRVWETEPGENITWEEKHTAGMLLTPVPATLQASYLDFPGGRGFTNLGRFVFRPQGVPWVVRTAGGTVQSLICAFDTDAFETMMGKGDGRHFAKRADCLNIRSQRIAQLLQTIKDEVLAPGFASAVLTEALGTALLVQLARYFEGSPDRDLRDDCGLAPWQMRKVDSYLEGLCGKAPSASDLADLCGVSTRQLLRKFRRTTGQSIAHYLAGAQLAKAQALLRGSNLPLKEISYRLGFTSHSNFTAAFRKAAGETPSNYRRRYG